MYERVLSASNIRSEQQRLIENYARQIESRHGGRGDIKLHIQFDSFIGQRPIVLAVTFKPQSSITIYFFGILVPLNVSISPNSYTKSCKNNKNNQKSNICFFSYHS